MREGKLCLPVLFPLSYLESVLIMHTKEGQGNVIFTDPFACSISLCGIVVVTTSLLHCSFWLSDNKNGLYAPGLWV